MLMYEKKNQLSLNYIIFPTNNLDRKIYHIIFEALNLNENIVIVFDRPGKPI